MKKYTSRSIKESKNNSEIVGTRQFLKEEENDFYFLKNAIEEGIKSGRSKFDSDGHLQLMKIKRK